MIVKCISDNFEPVSELGQRILEAIRIVGDDDLLPKIGDKYEVVGYCRNFETNSKAYELAEIDTSIYGGRLCFMKEHFEVVDNTFVPNTWINFGSYEGPARIVNLTIEGIKL